MKKEQAQGILGASKNQIEQTSDKKKEKRQVIERKEAPEMPMEPSFDGKSESKKDNSENESYSFGDINESKGEEDN